MEKGKIKIESQKSDKEKGGQWHEEGESLCTNSQNERKDIKNSLAHEYTDDVMNEDVMNSDDQNATYFAFQIRSTTQIRFVENSILW